MVLAAVLVDACHAALENAKEAFNGVRCCFTARIFATAVVDGFMFREFLAGRFIVLCFVGI